MDQLKNAVKVVMRCVVETRRDLIEVQKDTIKLSNQQEGVEHRLSNLEEGVEHRLSNLEERLTDIEKYMDVLATHMNDAIGRINTIHLYLKREQEEEQSLLCNEEMLLSTDDEFSFDEYDPEEKIKEQ